MDHFYIERAKEFVGKEVTLRGWLYNKRDSGRVKFLLLRDGTGIMQAVMVKGEVGDALFDGFDALTQESSLMVSGKVREEKRSPGGYELSIKGIEVVQLSHDYPITPKEHGVGFLMDHRHLWLRSKRQHAIMRIRAEIIQACQDYLNGNGFTLIDAPIFTPSACEGTTTLFGVDYFGRKAYLTQSGQLYNEAAAMAFGKVYCFGPSFRAEKAKTRRHLTEFWQVEPEMAYAGLNETIEVCQDLLLFILRRVLERRREELERLERDVGFLERIKPPFPRISYDQALKIIKEEGEELQWGEDFGAPQETALSQRFDTPFFVHRYPTQCKAFYMKRDEKDPRLALCVDGLAPEGYGEIIGGGEREDDLQVLKQRIKEYDLPEEDFQWYLDLRRFGSVSHSGFGLGIERTVAWICKLSHVREAIPFPRMLDRIKP